MIFEKWHGIGNDFVLLGRVPIDLSLEDLSELSVAICKRTFGVGADGLLLGFDSDVADCRMVMLNPDGSEAEMCGNGLRCFARWWHENSEGSGDYQIETGAGVLRSVVDDEFVSVEMGKAEILGSGFPRSVTVGGQSFDAIGVSMGNPHLIVFVDGDVAVDVEKWGRELEFHPAFPDRVNVHFLSQGEGGSLIQRTWERGAGVTLACGTGACACAVAGRERGWSGDEVLIHLPGGDLTIRLTGLDVTMTGEAARTFRGRWLGKRGCWPDED